MWGVWRSSCRSRRTGRARPDRVDAYPWLPLLTDEKQRQIAAYESALPHASTANAGVFDELQTLLAENRQHLQQLQAI